MRFDYRRVFEAKQGKHHALNAALATVTTPLVVTVDADTLVHPQSLTRLVVRVTTTPQGQHVCACAAALVAGNPTATFVTRMQQWDYRLGINGVKRMQAAYNTALVAQGAFSAYWTSDLRAVGGWPDAIGEDIVLTWTMLGSRGLVQYEPLALGFTIVPEHLDRLLSQRSRWARGMLEGLGAHPPRHQPRILAKLVAGIDYLVPLLDIGVIFFWVPGVILFLFGYPLIFGWWSMLLIPITLAVFGFLERWQDTARLPHARHPPRARQTRLHRLPLRLPSPHLRSSPPRLRPVRRRSRPPLAVAGRTMSPGCTPTGSGELEAAAVRPGPRCAGSPPRNRRRDGEQVPVRGTAAARRRRRVPSAYPQLEGEVAPTSP